MKKRTIKLFAILLCLFGLCSCVPSANPETAEKNLTRKEYDVQIISKDSVYGSLILSPYEGLEIILKGSKTNSEDANDFEFVEVWYFNSKDNAKKVYEESVENDFKDTVALYQLSNPNIAEKIEYGISGKLLYIGTEKAIKIA